MKDWLDTSTFEYTSVRMRLRDDLRVSVRHDGPEPYCILEDPVQNRFFRIGFAEYTLVSLFDGRNSLQDAVQATSCLLGDKALNEQQAGQVCDWLLKNGLADTRATGSGRRRHQQQESEKKRNRISLRNPLMIQMPLGNPDPFFRAVTNWFGWMFGPLGAVAWTVLFCLGLYTVASTGLPLQRSLESVIAPNQWWSLALVGIGLKVVHELAHGICCRRMGGRVTEFGLFWFLLIPLPYVDVSSSWSFENRGHRMLVAAAGMMAELFVVAIATLVWKESPFSLVGQLAAQTILLGSVVTLAFNLNPLMRFDGYYLLCDWLRRPNLAIHGRAWVTDGLRRLFLGIRRNPSTPDQGALCALYGILALGWQVLVVVSILVGAFNLVSGIGLVLLLVGLLVWLLAPLIRFVWSLMNSPEYTTGHRLRFAGSVMLFAGLIGMAGLLPSPEFIAVDTVIMPCRPGYVRAARAGRVERVLVSEGQFVQAGTPLVKLCNHELDLSERVLSAEQQYLLLEKRTAIAEHRVGDITALDSRLDHVRRQLSEIVDARKELTIRAPDNGRVFSDGMLQELDGRQIQAGTKICQLLDDRKMELVGLVPESDARFLKNGKYARIRCLVWGGRQLELDRSDLRVDPAATRTPPHFALASMAGGVHTVIDSRTLNDSGHEQWQLTKAGFPCRISLSGNSASGLRPGQTARLKIRAREQNLGSYLIEKGWQWLGTRLKQSHGI